MLPLTNGLEEILCGLFGETYQLMVRYLFLCRSKEICVRRSLYNDPMNKREFVARCLVEICSLDDGEAFSVMMNAHKNGLSVIGTWQKELAEMYKQQLQEEGLFVDMVPADKDGDE